MSVPEKLMLSANSTGAMENQKHRMIAVCMGTGCASSASSELREALRKELDEHGLGQEVEVRRTGCFGFCEQGPIAVMHPEQTFYTRVKPSDASAIARTRPTPSPSAGKRYSGMSSGSCPWRNIRSNSAEAASASGPE